MSDSLWPLGLYVAPRLLCPWDFPGKNTGMGCHFLLQEIFPTQGLNLGLPHCRQMLYRLSHQGNHDLVRGIFVKLEHVHKRERRVTSTAPKWNGLSYQVKLCPSLVDIVELPLSIHLPCFPSSWTTEPQFCSSIISMWLWTRNTIPISRDRSRLVTVVWYLAFS